MANEICLVSRMSNKMQVVGVVPTLLGPLEVLTESVTAGTLVVLTCPADTKYLLHSYFYHSVLTIGGVVVDSYAFLTKGGNDFYLAKQHHQTVNTNNVALGSFGVPIELDEGDTVTLYSSHANVTAQLSLHYEKVTDEGL